MKGVILAGGLGTRLRPLTLITNKHLLPVYDRPMILYPLETLRRSGINEVLVVCGREHSGQFMSFLGSGEQLGVHLSFAQQEKDDGGIADALRYAEDFADRGPVAVILGDNIFEESFRRPVVSFHHGATIFLKQVPDPHRFGVAVLDERGRVREVQEKPKEPASDLAQTGLYLFGSDVFEVIRSLRPSARGELEVTDVVNHYIRLGKLTHHVVEKFWADAGTHEALMEAAQWVRQQRHGSPAS